MKTAIDFYSRGKQKESSADEYCLNGYYERNRFACPECGESVHLIAGKYANFFGHYKKLSNSVECDRRVDTVSTISLYEKLGLPLYIKKNGNEEFTLCIGFKALPIAVIDFAEKNKMALEVDGMDRYLINRQRFSCEQSVFLPLEYIPSAEMKYQISYFPAEKAQLVKSHWGDYADGFTFWGAIFSVTETGGRKVRQGDNIYSDTEYYWVKSTSHLITRINGIDMNLVGKLKLKQAEYYVFKVKFRSNISDNQYDILAKYLRENLKLFLVEKKPEFIPLWPPVIKREEGYFVDSNIKRIYGRIISGNDTPKIYYYQGIGAVPVDELVNKNKVLSVPMSTDSVVINIDRKYVSNGCILIRGRMDAKYIENNIFLEQDEERIPIQNKYIYSDKNIITLFSQIKTEYVLVKQKGLIERTIIIGEYKVDDLKDGDQIFILQHKNYVAKIHIKNERINEDVNYKVSKLVKGIEQYKNAKKVVMPHTIRMILIKMKGKDKKLDHLINRILFSNVIALPLIEILGGKENGRNRL